MAERRTAGPLNQNPGPGDYSVDDTIVRENSPARTIPKGVRGASLGYESQPGPGHYDDSKKEVIMYQNLSYTIPLGERMSPMSRDQRLNPGPGTYNGQPPFGKDGLHVIFFFNLTIYSTPCEHVAPTHSTTKIQPPGTTTMVNP